MPTSKGNNNSSNDNNNAASVYEESLEMLTGSLMIYLFAEIRDIARETSNSKLLQDLNPPLSATETMAIIKNHQEALEERAIDHQKLQERLKAFDHLQEQAAAAAAASTSKDDFNFLTSFFTTLFPQKNENVEVAVAPKQVILKQFQDDNSKQEIVHAIVVNQRKERITVIFRGSVTPKDFLQDSKCAQIKIPNPAMTEENKNEESITPTINIHTGFYEYLFYKKTKNDKTRLEIILEQVYELLEEYPTFSLYCTGHSLGGALCTLFGFFAACDPNIKGMVSVYSIASPYVGNWKFRQAYLFLECHRRIQHLRIANHDDLVTLMPFAVPKASFLSPALSMIVGGGNLYKHTGIRLRLEESGKQSFAYPKDFLVWDNEEEYAKEVLDSVESGKSLLHALYALCKSDFATIEQHHSCLEYELRLQACQEILSKRTLNDLYRDISIVGTVLTPDRKSLGNNNNKPKDGWSRTLKVMSVIIGANGNKKKADEKNGNDDEEEQLTMTEAALLEEQKAKEKK